MIAEKIIFNIVFMPLLGALSSYFGGKKLGDRFAQIISSAFIILSALSSIIIFKSVIFDKNIYEVNLFEWITLENLKISWSLYVDQVTAVMLFVVTSVSAVVHLYSIGYMEEDDSIPRFMSYLSLFTFFMLILVTSNNILQLFVGWEGVGLCSYLLIGFWYYKQSANNAAMKAFIVNRVGDFAFMLGIAGLFLYFNSVDFKTIFANSSSLKNQIVTIFQYDFKAIDLVCCLLFIGAMGKSAQIGLHTWLPDAMEGPTPVSALIHAATMVTAGVFLVIRLSPIFELSENILSFITYIGAITAFFAATIALTQNDIKKIVAYSTCSQLGYMFFACGVGAYPIALFHLMTHAFFKALLFLGSGNVIYATHHEQDITKMGGLWKKIPITYSLVLIGSLALAGIYPFAGYFSKDLILEIAYLKGTSASITAFTLGSVGAFLTALYSFRLLFLTFHGKSKLLDAHDAKKIMIIPLVILALGAIFSGMLAINLGILSPHFWQNSLVFNSIIEQAHHLPLIIKLTPIIASFCGIFCAYVLYIYNKELPEIFVHSFNGLYLLLRNKYFIDEIYNFIFVQPFKFCAELLWKVGDIKIIDGFGPNGLAFASQQISNKISKIQSGYIYNYILVMIIGIVGIITWYLVR